jgi:general secretion pathway protein L
MEKRYIGIDIDSGMVRVAIVIRPKGEEQLLSVTRREYGDAQELQSALQEMIGDTRLFSDRLAVAVPAVEGFVRTLSFPFNDPKKIAATLPFELAAQLPIPIEDCSTDFQKPIPAEQGGFTVTAAAVRTTVLRQLVDVFERAEIPLHVVDIHPFAPARGLRGEIPHGLLASIGEQGSTLALVRDGLVVDYRLLPASNDGDSAGIARFIHRERVSLLREAGNRELPLYLIGAGASQPLQDELQRLGLAFVLPACHLRGETVAPEFLPAVALALRAAVPDRERPFNYRHGEFALKNEWTALKKEVTVAALVLLLAVVALGGSAYLHYAHQHDRAEALRAEMTRIYRDTFPGNQPIHDVSLQMSSSLKELQARGRSVGLGLRGSPLAVLQEISRNVPADIMVDIRDLHYQPETIRLEGITTSFDAVNRMARSLEQSTLFREAQIADAKMSLDGSRIDFRITLSFTERSDR